MSAEHIQFPQSPFVGPDGYVSFEWQQWLLNPQFLTINFSVAVGVPSGGTGISLGTDGGILGFTGTTTIASSALLTQNALVLGGGAGATPSTPIGLGTSTTVLHGNASGPPSFGTVSLTTDVSGVLPAGNVDLSAVVPYTGAANNVDLGAHSMTATGLVSASDVTSNNAAALIKTAVALTDAAGVALGSLTNAPTAGDPTKWIQINDNGTTRKIPTWT